MYNITMLVSPYPRLVLLFYKEDVLWQIKEWKEVAKQ